MSGGFAIGIDVGGTKTAAGLLDPASGERMGERILPTPERGRDVLAACLDLARGLLATAPQPVRAIGIGLPEIVDPAGRPVTGGRIDWRGIDLAAAFAGMPPVLLDADVRAAARGEARLGAGAAFRHWVYVSIGTGVSSAIVTGGEPMTGARGAALVLASGPVSFACPACGETVSFTLEEFASGPAIAAAWERASGRTGAARDAIAAAGKGSPAALRVLGPVVAALGGAIGWLVNVADPEAVVLGGGLGAAGGWWGATLAAAIRDHVWNPAARDLPILPAGLGAAAGWAGAAVTAAERLAAPP